MKYGYTIIYVEDVESSLEFYKNAFEFDIKFMTPEKDYGELITGETTIAFASISLGNSNFKRGFTSISKVEKPIGVELVLISDQIEVDFEYAISKGAKPYEAIQQKPWGQKVGYLLDPNGLLIEICTPMPA